MSNHETENTEPSQVKDELFELIYFELKQYARKMIFSKRLGSTLGATVLVHDTWLKLSTIDRIRWENKTHFFRIAALAMRQIVIDECRKKNFLKNAKHYQIESFDEESHFSDEQALAIVKLNEALDELSIEDKQLADVVICRYFAGYSEEETAAILGIPLRSVQRYWSKSKLVLKQKIKN